MAITVDLQGRVPATLDKRRLLTLVDAAYRHGGGRGPAVVALSFVSDKVIRRLNRQWRGEDHATDVLSFGQSGIVPTGSPSQKGSRQLGDIIVSWPTARRQAHAAGRDLMTEVSSLVVHAMLHLLGQDHAQPAAARRMFARQQEILLRQQII